jgi:hypothetical protein
MILGLLLTVGFALVALNIWATWRMIHDDLSTALQKAALMAFIWAVPYLGAVLVLHLLRKHPERRSGQYPEEYEPADSAVHRASRSGAETTLLRTNPHARKAIVLTISFPQILAPGFEPL